MFNRTGITKITGSAPVQILFDVEHQMSVPVKVAAASENYVTENGRKIVKAGTLLRVTSPLVTPHSPLPIPIPQLVFCCTMSISPMALPMLPCCCGAL